MGMDKSKKQVWTILSTPIDEIEFRKFREENDDFWLTKERELMWIDSMETRHIISCVNMLERCDQQYTKAYEGLTKELNRRYDHGERWEYEN